jgi:acetyl esterase/lipase
LIVPPLIRRPLIVWIHGGGWRGGSRADFSPAWTWVDSGYSVASLDYRLSGRKKWPAQIHDVKAAIRWLRANADAFALDTARFVVWGESAGGHLAAMAGLTTPADALDGAVGDHLETSSHVRGVIDYYGPTNFLEPIPKRWTPWSSVGELLGCGVRKCMDRAMWASPVSYVNRGDVPFLIVHGIADTIVPPSQSFLLDSLLRAAHVPVELRIVKEGHGGPAFYADSAQAWVGGFLARVLGSAALPAAHGPPAGVPEVHLPGGREAP